MIRKTQGVTAMGSGRCLGAAELAALRRKVNSEDYLRAAIHRIALVISNELLDIPKEGVFHEQQKRQQYSVV